MAAVAQWQSTALWMQMLRVRPPSAAQSSNRLVESGRFFSTYSLISR